jgi:hypothetical protein
LVYDNALGPDAIVDLLPEGAVGGHVPITSGRTPTGAP